MVALVQDSLGAIHDLCRRRGVQRLYLVGSATGTDFDPARSDLDFLIEFQPLEREGLGGLYFQFLQELETLLDAKVDLIERHCVENPYVRASLEGSKVPLYAAA